MIFPSDDIKTKLQPTSLFLPLIFVPNGSTRKLYTSSLTCWRLSMNMIVGGRYLWELLVSLTTWEQREWGNKGAAGQKWWGISWIPLRRARDKWHIWQWIWQQIWYNYTADLVYNVDESRLVVVQSNIPHVVGLIGKRQVGAITSAERGSLVTVICCVRAGVTFIPPMIIFLRKYCTDTLMKGAPPGVVRKCHPTG